MTARPGRPLVLRLVGAAVVLAGVAFTLAFVLVLVAAQADERQAADAIVVLGAAQYRGRPSPVLRARLDHAAGLWRAGLAPAVLVTGGTAAGDIESEAAVAARYLRQLGLPDSAVVVVPEGRTTRASMDAVGRWAAAAGAKHVLLVSDPFHMLRLRLEAARLGLTATTSPTASSPISGRPGVELEYLLAETLKLPIAWLGTLRRS